MCRDEQNVPKAPLLILGFLCFSFALSLFFFFFGRFSLVSVISSELQSVGGELWKVIRFFDTETWKGGRTCVKNDFLLPKQLSARCGRSPIGCTECDMYLQKGRLKGRGSGHGHGERRGGGRIWGH